MSTELFHLAADGCHTQVILKLIAEENYGEGLTNWKVITCVCTNSEDDIDSILTALGANHSSDVNIMTWRSDFDIKPLLNLTKSTEIKSKHLIQYLCKRYNFKIEF